jgi:hypothetical protein
MRNAMHQIPEHTQEQPQPPAPAADGQPTIGVVIVSYNTSAMLRDCLRSLASCQLPLHIVVVDNASHDDSVSMVRRDFPNVHLLALAHNQGFAAANNHGLRCLGFASTASAAPASPPPAYALLLNPDTIVHPGAIETLLAFAQAHPRVGVVGPRLLNADGSLQTAAFRFPTLSMSLLDVFPPGDVLPGRLYDSWWHGRYPQAQQPANTQPCAIDHPLGACMLVRRAAIDEVGLLDARYFMYSEEIDWCWRIRRAGWAIWHEPRAQITHLGGGATRQVRHSMLIELHRSRVRFFQQHYPARLLRAHRLITRLGMLRLILRSWRAYARGQLGRDDLRARLWAYHTICRL